jgi:enediyne biosynthesis protein E4
MKRERTPSGDEKADVGQDDAVIASAFKKSLVVIVSAAVLLTIVWAVAGFFRSKPKDEIPTPVAPTVRKVEQDVPNLPLVDITKESGIQFVHHRGDEGEKLLPETMGSGVAIFDFDNDNDCDVLLVDSTKWPWGSQAASGSCKLYSNDGKGKFTDVSEATGMNASLYGMGVAIGDIDNDGWTDVFLSAVGGNRLYHNQSGKFVDITESAKVGTGPDHWSTSAAFLDFDRDGRLDLFVGNYITWSRSLDLSQSFTLRGDERAYGPPRAFSGNFPSLYRNMGNNTFEDVSKSAGLHILDPNTNVAVAKSMGVTILDADDDGWVDVVVANDTVPNFLLINQKNGTFLDVAPKAGIAYDRSGTARGAMGIDAAIFRPDGSMAVGIGNFANEPCSLYLAKASKRMNFVDVATSNGFGPPTRVVLTFGLFFFDVDLDGRLDVLNANGHLEPEISSVFSTQRYEQPPQLFWNAGAGASNELLLVPEEKTGRSFTRPMVGRGAAYGDLDGDGDLDVVLTASGGEPRVLRNDQSSSNHWLRIKLTGTKANRSGIGAQVRLIVGQDTYTRMLTPARSYLSQCELVQTFGIGKAATVDAVEVVWPDGSTQRVVPEVIDQTIEIVQPAS